MEAGLKERMRSEADDAQDPRAEGLDEDRQEQHAHAVDGAGQAAVGNGVELGSYDHYKRIHGQMDSTPEVEMVL